MTEDRPRRIAWIHGRVVHRYGIQPGLLTRGAVESLVQKIDLLRPGASRAAAILRPALNSGRRPSGIPPRNLSRHASPERRSALLRIKKIRAKAGL